MKWVILITVFVVWFGIIVPILNHKLYELMNRD